MFYHLLQGVRTKIHYRLLVLVNEFQRRHSIYLTNTIRLQAGWHRRSCYVHVRTSNQRCTFWKDSSLNTRYCFTSDVTTTTCSINIIHLDISGLHPTKTSKALSLSRVSIRFFHPSLWTVFGRWKKADHPVTGYWNTSSYFSCTHAMPVALSHTTATCCF